MNIRNYRKRFTKWAYVRSTNTTNDFGAEVVGESVAVDFMGYYSKNQSKRQADSISEARADGILFTGKEVILHKGDIVSEKYQVLDACAFKDHIEYELLHVDKWGK